MWRSPSGKKQLGDEHVHTHDQRIVANNGAKVKDTDGPGPPGAPESDEVSLATLAAGGLTPGHKARPGGDGADSG